jgi:hypothetical protein
VIERNKTGIRAVFNGTRTVYAIHLILEKRLGFGLFPGNRKPAIPAIMEVWNICF